MANTERPWLSLSYSREIPIVLTLYIMSEQSNQRVMSVRLVLLVESFNLLRREFVKSNSWIWKVQMTVVYCGVNNSALA